MTAPRPIVIRVRVTPAELRRVKAMARTRQLTVSDLVRDAIKLPMRVDAPAKGDPL